MKILLVADHASDTVPPGIDLGIDAALMRTHIAVDIGVAPLTLALADRLGATAVLGEVSRLVIDLNRELESPGLVPAHSDGIAIPGNHGLGPDDRDARIAAFHGPYHERLSSLIEAKPPALIVSVHSFTPALGSRDEPRPWPIAFLYNRDDRAARFAIDRLRAEGIDAGDNQPYSGRDLNYTMNRHAETRGLPYLGIEVRQDGLSDAAGIDRWTDVIADTISTFISR